MPPEQTKGLKIDQDTSNAAPPPVENYYLLVIAIDHYKKDGLNNPVRDANELVNVLTTRFTFYKPPHADDLRIIDPRYIAHENVMPVYKHLKTMCLYNEDATRNKIDDHISAVYKEIGEDDAFLIFFSGHGLVDGSYQIMAFDDLPERNDKEYTIDGLYNRFRNFNAKKCRYLLIILDSCFAGSAITGPVGQEPANFSRYIVTSCNPDQEACDGQIGKGSPFAVYLQEKLSSSSALRTELDQSFFKGIQHRLELETDSKQQISYDRAPGSSSGTIFFPIIKREVAQPEKVFLRDSFIDYLNFDKQRLNLTEYYRHSCNHLNIITTQSSSLDIRNVFAKIFVRWLSDPDNGKLFGSDEQIKDEVIRLEIPSEEHIWDRVAKNVSLPDLAQDRETSIITWCFDQLITDYPDEGKRRVILWMEIKSGGAHFASGIDTFCVKFSQLFLEKYNQLLPYKKECMGKLFIFISDESTGGDWQRDTFLLKSRTEKLNFISTDRINPVINRNHFNQWRRKIESNEAKLLQMLKKDEVLKELFQANQGGDFSCSYDEFIVKIYAHCGFLEGEIESERVDYIYNNKKLIL